MYMRMKQQSLIPCVQHAEEPDLRSEMARISSYFEQRLGACTKQQVEDDLLVLQCNGSQFTRYCEHGMHVARGQQLPFPRLEPALACVALALRAVPVPA